MKFKGTIGDQFSGSIGGLTASHNRGGYYFRQRVIPVNPSSSFQQAVRALVAELTSRWGTTLTASQREGWTTYSDNVPISDTLGDPRKIGGLPQYIRSNVPRLQAGLSRVDDAPSIFDQGILTPPGITSITGSTDIAIVTFTNTDTWAVTTGGALLVYASRGVNPSINYFKGPFRFAGSVLGNTTTPPTSPQNITMPFNVVAGQRVFLQFRGTASDGRLTPPFRAFSTVS